MLLKWFKESSQSSPKLTTADKALKYLEELQSFPSQEAFQDYLKENDIKEIYFLTHIGLRLSELGFLNKDQQKFLSCPMSRCKLLDYFYSSTLSESQIEYIENILYPVEQNSAPKIVDATKQSVAQIY